MSRKIVYFIQIFIKSFNTNLKTKTMNLKKLFEKINSTSLRFVSHDYFGKRYSFISGCFQNRHVAKFDVFTDCHSINNINEM